MRRRGGMGGIAASGVGVDRGVRAAFWRSDGADEGAEEVGG